MEARLQGATVARLRCLAEPVRHTAFPEALQPALGPLRDWRQSLPGMGPLDGGAHVRPGAGAAVCRAIPEHLQGIPAAPENRQLLARQRARVAATEIEEVIRPF